MDINPKLAKLLKRLDDCGFRHREKYGEALTKIFELYENPDYRLYRSLFVLIRDWLLVPYSFWPVDFNGIARFMHRELTAGRVLDRRFLLATRFLHDYPPALARELVAANERNVQVGEYRQFVRSNSRYESYERLIVTSQKLKMEWEEIKALFPMELFLDKKGIVRRTMVCERNFKTIDFLFGWEDIEDQFQAVFDSFCFRWSLYGMEKDQPLLLKLTVNVTPHGTMIMIPFYMSPDFRRDIHWKMVTKVHKVNGAMKRQGDKLMQVQIERDNDAERTYKAAQKARDKGLKGEDRRLFIIEDADLPPSYDLRRIRHLCTQHENFLQMLKDPDASDAQISESEVMADYKAMCVAADAAATKAAPTETQSRNLRRAREAVARLSPEERELFMKEIN